MQGQWSVKDNTGMDVTGHFAESRNVVPRGAQLARRRARRGVK